MELKRSNNKISIKGTIKTIEDINSILEALNQVQEPELLIEIEDSYVIPSTVIGHLLRLTSEGKVIKMKVNEPLYELLSDLDFDQTFNLSKL